MDESSEELAFVTEQVEQLSLEIIESTLKDKVYNDDLAQSWIDEICSKINKELIEMNKPFKYIVTCIIMQKNGAGIHSTNSCFWDSANDNSIQIKWPGEKKKDNQIQSIVSVFGVAH